MFHGTPLVCVWLGFCLTFSISGGFEMLREMGNVGYKRRGAVGC